MPDETDWNNIGWDEYKEINRRNLEILEQRRAFADRQEQEKIERERLEKERVEKAKIERERLQREHFEREQRLREQEKREQEEREQQQRKREEQERLKKEQAEKEQAEREWKQRELEQRQREREEQKRRDVINRQRAIWVRDPIFIRKQITSRLDSFLARKLQIQRPEFIAKGKHKYPVTSVAISPDSSLTLTGSDDKTVKLWETATGKELLTLEGHDESIQSVAFSPCGKFALTGSIDTTARIWSLETAEEVVSLEGHKYTVQSAVFSPDGTKVLTGSRDYMVKLWDVKTGDEIRTFQGHNDSVWSVAFTSCGRFFLSGGHYGYIRFWETDSGRLLHSFYTNKKVNSVRFSFGDKSFIASYDDNCEPEVWKLDDCKSSRIPLGHGKPLWSAMFFPFPYSKCLVSCGKDCTIRVWDKSRRSVIHTFTDHTKPVPSAVVSPNGRFLVSGDDAGEVIFRLLPDWEREERLAYERDKNEKQKQNEDIGIRVIGRLDNKKDTATGDNSDSTSSDAKSATTKKIELAAPERVDVIVFNSNTICVTWDKVDSASSYEVQFATSSFTTSKRYYKSDEQTVSVPSDTKAGLDMSELLHGLTANTTYYVRVKSIGSGKYSDSEYSAEKSARTEKTKNFWTSLLGLITKPASTVQRSRPTAGLLAFFFGMFGAHDFYLGYKKEGIIKLLLTIPGCLIIVGPLISFGWAIHDLIRICNGSMSDVHDRELKPSRLITIAVSSLLLIMFIGTILRVQNGKNVNPTDQNPPTQNHTPQDTATQSDTIQNPTPQIQVPPLSIDTEVNVNLPDTNEDADSINDDQAEDDLIEGNQTEMESAATTIPSQLPPTDATAQPNQTDQPEEAVATASNTSKVKTPTSRIWTSGNFTVEAELVDISQDRKTIKLRRKDNGKIISVPVERLSQEDQDYVAESRTDV